MCLASGLGAGGGGSGTRCPGLQPGSPTIPAPGAPPRPPGPHRADSPQRAWKGKLEAAYGPLEVVLKIKPRSNRDSRGW